MSQLLTDSYQDLISEQQVTRQLPLVAGFIVANELMHINCTVAPGGRLHVRVEHFNLCVVHPLFYDLFHLYLFPTPSTCLSHSFAKAAS